MMYASHGRETSSATTSKEVHTAIDTLVNKLHSRLSSRETFPSEFGNALYYSSEKPEARRLVQYALKVPTQLRGKRALRSTTVFVTSSTSVPSQIPSHGHPT